MISYWDVERIKYQIINQNILRPKILKAWVFPYSGGKMYSNITNMLKMFIYF